jgi:hypothetical protein
LKKLALALVGGGERRVEERREERDRKGERE